MKPKTGDNIAYVCVDFNKEKQYLLNNEPKPTLVKYLGRLLDSFEIRDIVCIDDKTIDLLVQDEISKQTGFTIKDEEIGRIFNVGVIHIDNTDKFCHLFTINVTDLEQDADLCTDTVNFEPVWCDALQVMILNTWRPQTILKKTEFIAWQKKMNAENETKK